MLPAYTNRDAFAIRLNELVSPSQPIQTIEHLYGRAHELDQIDKALYAPGRHVFIYGDRGVGKSSLAAAAARQYQSADEDYIDIGCGPDATLSSIVTNIALQALSQSRLNAKRTSAKAALNLRFLTLERSAEDVSRDLHAEIRTVGDAVEVLREAAGIHSEKPIVVLDEFDRIKDAPTRHIFADLIKQLGDKKINLKFIFTGVAGSLHEILGAHQSAIRQLATIHLERLSWDARWDIARAVTGSFGLKLPRDIEVRIAAVSDGFPYYVHLVTEKILWRVWEDPNEIQEIEWEHYRDGLRDAIDSIDAELHRPYEIVMTQRTDDYEEVLWSTADGEMLHRYTGEMFTSYQYIMKHRADRDALTLDRFKARIRALRMKRTGEILVTENARKGLYWYRETMLRGYVRMQAEANGIELVGDKDPTVSKHAVHVPSSARKGYRGSSVPPGVSLSRKIRS